MKTVVAVRGDGLGTRILTIMRARLLAEHLGWSLDVLWPPLGSPHYDDVDLLAAHELGSVLAGRHVFRDGAARGRLTEHIEAQGRAISTQALGSFPLTRERLAALAAEVDVIFYETPDPILSDGDIGFPQVQRIRAFWAEIDWSAELREALARVLRRIDRDRTVALHVRRGDIVNVLREAELPYLAATGMEQVLQRFTAIASFREALRGAVTWRHRHILVCGEAAEGALGSRRGVRLARIVGTGEGGSATFRAFLDLCVLAEMPLVIAPALSYFSLCATTVGGGRLHAIPLDVPKALAEVFGIVDGSGRTDAAAVKALACAVFARMLAPSDRLRVDCVPVP